MEISEYKKFRATVEGTQTFFWGRLKIHREDEISTASRETVEIWMQRYLDSPHLYKELTLIFMERDPATGQIVQQIRRIIKDGKLLE